MRNDKIYIVHHEAPASLISADAEVDCELAGRVSEILHGDCLIDAAKNIRAGFESHCLP